MTDDSGLGLMDFALLIGSMLISAFIGLYFTNKNKSFDSYMLGDRQLSVLPVAISLMTSCMSGLTLLGSSAELYYQGPSYSFVFVAILLAGPITAYTILPVFHRMNELSLYRYLERRYGLLIKYFASIVFIFQMIFYNAVVLYLPAMALQSILGIPKLYSILGIGLMCVLYSSVGGIKAVVWTDLFQAFLMYSSIITVGIMGTIDAGGFGNVYKNALDGERLQMDGFFNLDLTTRHTLLGILIGSTLKHVILIGVNQVQIQRALALPSLKQGQLSLVLCSLFTAGFTLLATYMGLVMYSSYRSCDPFLANQIPRRDAIIVHYIANRLNQVPGARGIFIAGVFSATLSTLSSFANSMSALMMEDFVKPLVKALGHKGFETSGSKSTWLPKIIAATFGLICVLMAYTIDKANSRLLQATTTMFGAIGVPFLAAFLLGIYTRFTNSAGVAFGLLVTLTLGSYITLYQVFFMRSLEPQLPVYYDEQCEQVFNRTISSSLLTPVNELYLDGLIPTKLPEVIERFSIERISYMTLPMVQFILMVLISTVVSLLTGGASQIINDDCLVTMLHKNQPSNGGTIIAGDGKVASLGQYIMENSLAKSNREESKSEPNGKRLRRKGVVNRGFDLDGS